MPPESICVSWLTQRSSVVLPEPEAPIRHSTSRGATSIETDDKRLMAAESLAHLADGDERLRHRPTFAVPRAK